MSNALSDDAKKRIADFALKDYELKIAYLTAHFQRVWTRFNYFVVIEAALIGGKTIFGDKAISTAGLWSASGALRRSACSTKWRRPWLQHAASVIGPGLRLPS
jgi:hypothetical protein